MGDGSPEKKFKLGNLQDAHLSGDGKWIAAATTWNGKIVVMDTVSRDYVETIERDELPDNLAGAKVVRFSPDCAYLACLLSSKVLQVWETRFWRCVFTSKQHKVSTVHWINWSPDSKHLVAVTDYHTKVDVWNIEKKRFHHRAERTGLLFEQALFSADGSLVIATAKLREEKTKRFFCAWNVPSFSLFPVTKSELCSALTHIRSIPHWQSTVLALGHFRGRVSLVDIASDQQVGEISTQQDSIDDIQPSPNGRLIACAFPGVSVEIWDLYTQQKLARLRDFDGQLRLGTLSWSENGRYLAASPGINWDGADPAWLWDLFELIPGFKLDHLIACGLINTPISTPWTRFLKQGLYDPRLFALFIRPFLENEYTQC